MAVSAWRGHAVTLSVWLVLGKAMWNPSSGLEQATTLFTYIPAFDCSAPHAWPALTLRWASIIGYVWGNRATPIRALAFRHFDSLRICLPFHAKARSRTSDPWTLSSRLPAIKFCVLDAVAMSFAPSALFLRDTIALSPISPE